MRFSFVLAVAAALTASVSAALIPAESIRAIDETSICPWICMNDGACKTCNDGNKCVSMSGLPWMHILKQWDEELLEADYTTSGWIRGKVRRVGNFFECGKELFEGLKARTHLGTVLEIMDREPHVGSASSGWPARPPWQLVTWRHHMAVLGHYGRTVNGTWERARYERYGGAFFGVFDCWEMVSSASDIVRGAEIDEELHRLLCEIV
ncbi:hypothetical protein DFH29DRAFT_1017512 [Suillus ampliporus]|nr:hypothetical protein DFH29DRAFT_1017512 [Suillus ampliporus]